MSDTPRADAAYADVTDPQAAASMYETACKFERELAAAQAQLDATCSPESFADLIRQRTALIVERDSLKARVATLESTLIDVQKHGAERIAELEHALKDHLVTDHALHAE